MTPPKTLECPYGPRACPKLTELEDRIAKMERNQNKMITTLYFIAGVVSVTLGVAII